MKTAHVHNEVIDAFPEPITVLDEAGKTVTFALADYLAPDYLAACVQVPAAAEVGWARGSDGSFAAPFDPEPRPAPVPASITDRQFAHALWRQNVITFDEAKAFVRTGELPTALADLIKMLPANQRQDAELMASGAAVYERHHPLTVSLLSAFGWTDEVADEFWRVAAAL